MPRTPQKTTNQKNQPIKTLRKINAKNNKQD
jgi:hypothetical protein